MTDNCYWDRVATLLALDRLLFFLYRALIASDECADLAECHGCVEDTAGDSHSQCWWVSCGQGAVPLGADVPGTRAAVWQNSAALEERPEKQTGAGKDPGMPSLVPASVSSGCAGRGGAEASGQPWGCGDSRAARHLPQPISQRPPGLSGAGSPPVPPPAGGSCVSPWSSACLGQRRRAPRILTALGHARRMSPPSRKSSSS